MPIINGDFGLFFLVYTLLNCKVGLHPLVKILFTLSKLKITSQNKNKGEKKWQET